MCGIIGYLGGRPALPLVLEGLRRLEYRGYDSAGIAVVDGNNSLVVYKSAGKLIDLISAIDGSPEGTTAIGHTRWATHGKPTVDNAHPHTDRRGVIAVVHNGIVENYRSLKTGLEDDGYRFQSETDTEVIPLLIERFIGQGANLEDAVRQTANLLHGAHAIAVISGSHPDRIIGVRIGNAGGLVVGFGDDGTYLSSDMPAILPHVNRVVYLRNGEMAILEPGSVRYTNLQGEAIDKSPEPVTQDPVAAAKGPYRHFMLKEIMEQSETLMAAMRDRIDFGSLRVALPDFPFDKERVASFSRVMLIGMGTSSHAAQIGRVMIERFARIPAEAENASEFRYRNPIIDSSCLVISVGQSGETVDTLVAMTEAQQRGAAQVTICNVAGSEATRIADYTMLINAGPEVAVASTKTFTGALVCLFLLAAYLGELRGTLSRDDMAELVRAIAHLPQQLGDLLQRDPQYAAVARTYAQSRDFLLLGRGVHYPVVMEAALKLKEVSYIHAEGYQAGEMKHGPIALIDESMPVLAVALQGPTYDKMMSNIEEVRARDGSVIAIATEGDEAVRDKAKEVMYIPETHELLAPILAIVPLQLLAYHIAVRRGCDVDQPRNLAKTVTVE